MTNEFPADYLEDRYNEALKHREDVLDRKEEEEFDDYFGNDEEEQDFLNDTEGEEYW